MLQYTTCLIYSSQQLLDILTKEQNNKNKIGKKDYGPFALHAFLLDGCPGHVTLVVCVEHKEFYSHSICEIFGVFACINFFYMHVCI